MSNWSAQIIADRRWWLHKLIAFLTDNEHTCGADGCRAFFLHLTRKKLSPASIQLVRLPPSAFGGWLVKEGRIGDNPTAAVPAPVLRDHGDVRIEYRALGCSSR